VLPDAVRVGTSGGAGMSTDGAAGRPPVVGDPAPPPEPDPAAAGVDEADRTGPLGAGIGACGVGAGVGGVVGPSPGGWPRGPSVGGRSGGADG
jgi:hypothetical protein